MNSFNLTDKIEKQLPSELTNFTHLAGEMAQKQGQKLYLVGGVVRDLLLERTNLDLDIVLEGDALTLAKHLAGVKQAKIITHSRFGTATLKWDNWSADFATARAETYAKPGALPTVKPGSINDDLFRRDFTINAMAIKLNAGYGELLDLYHGRADLRKKRLRVLHEKSFMDDATRIWRAIRYEQRLHFKIEPVTQELLKRDIKWLDSISGDRIRHELELALKEEYPEEVLQRADELGVLARLHPSLKGDKWLVKRFARASGLYHPECPPVTLYLALLIYRLNAEENEQLNSYLRLPRATARVLRDTLDLKTKIEPLANPKIAPSAIYSLLSGYTYMAVVANSLATDSIRNRKRIDLFLDRLRYVKPALTGDDLKRMGIPQGPRIKEVLEKLRAARLDGKVSSKREEERLVRSEVV